MLVNVTYNQNGELQEMYTEIYAIVLHPIVWNVLGKHYKRYTISFSEQNMVRISYRPPDKKQPVDINKFLYDVRELVHKVDNIVCEAYDLICEKVMEIE